MEFNDWLACTELVTGILTQFFSLQTESKKFIGESSGHFGDTHGRTYLYE